MTDIGRDIGRFLQESPIWNGPTETLGPSTPLLQNGALDSLGVLELTAFLEQNYRIEILDEEVVPEHFGTIESLVALVRSKL